MPLDDALAILMESIYRRTGAGVADLAAIDQAVRVILDRAHNAAIEEAALVACHRCRMGIPRYPYKSSPGSEQHRVGGPDGELWGECEATKIRALRRGA